MRNKVPYAIQMIIDGRLRISPADLLPTREGFKKTLPKISHPQALYYSQWLLYLRHNPLRFSLPLPAGVAPADLADPADSLSVFPQDPPPFEYTNPVAKPASYEIGFESPAQRKLRRELPARLAKINFVKYQMSRMDKIVAEWREKKRINRLGKEKKYPF